MGPLKRNWAFEKHSPYRCLLLLHIRKQAQRGSVTSLKSQSREVVAVRFELGQLDFGAHDFSVMVDLAIECPDICLNILGTSGRVFLGN